MSTLRMNQQHGESKNPWDVSLLHHDDPSIQSSEESSDDESSAGTPFRLADQAREEDEVREVKQFSKRDSHRVNLSRVIVTSALMLTALSVTFATFIFLEEQERIHFRDNFEQYARSIRDAALERHRDIHAAVKGMATVIGGSSQTENATWPYFSMPRFETYARNYREAAQIEVMAVFNVVGRNEREPYTNWANENYESMVTESHVLAESDAVGLDANTYSPYLFRWGANETSIPIDKDTAVSFVLWQFSPPPTSYGLINMDFGADESFQAAMQALVALGNETVTTSLRPYDTAIQVAFGSEEAHDALHSELDRSVLTAYAQHPHSLFFYPIHEDVGDADSAIVGVLGGGFAWDAGLQNALPGELASIHVVTSNNCNQSFTYRLDGKDAFYIGEGDKHEDAYTGMGLIVDVSTHTRSDFLTTPGHCVYTMNIYPTEEFFENFDTRTAEIFATVLMVTFVLVAGLFALYDVLVNIRQVKLVQSAAKSNAIVKSVFPETVRDRLNLGSSLKSFMVHGGDIARDSAPPLADLFLETTVLFADIAGFTAWSSTREPSQVFTLLETIYASFDVIAKRRRVFKVETVGDCYVAVVGLPDYRKDHAVVMARFAQEILHRMHTMSKDLETRLGPDTGDLDIRIGMHSGAVTGGVLRGERSRFQLFGDTMNTGSRMESTGARGRIQVSKETANFLIEAGKEAWLTPREDKIDAKGKGILETYWLAVAGRRDAPSVRSGSSSGNTSVTMMSSGEPQHDSMSSRTARLIDWNVEILLRLIRQIVARRNSRRATASSTASHVSSTSVSSSASTLPPTQKPLLVAKVFAFTDRGASFTTSKSGKTPLEDVREIITLPPFDTKIARKQQSPETVELPAIVVIQLRDYVTAIANMYRDNSFHNIDHASHVLMTVQKFMSRIVAPTDLDIDEQDLLDGGAAAGEREVAKQRKKVAMMLHDHTYGITSDPLTQFACAFSALIHDVDHTGVPNVQLIKENKELGNFYNNRSVAEQNSLDIAWDLLMAERYGDLRSCLYTNETELSRFRQLVVNSVMATDIADKDLKNLRNARWDKAFLAPQEGPRQAAPQTLEEARDAVNRKATIVIEHLIQASDVSHTMQHWHVYRKWNENLFMEMHRAFEAGRADKNPAEFWFKGEIGFFDFYIIPLAKKLKDCGVFGKSSDECLAYAISNRNEWEHRGEAVVAEMVEKLAAQTKRSPSDDKTEGAGQQGSQQQAADA